MQAVKLQNVSVGRCGSCHRFRNNMEFEVDKKIVCMDCFVKFKNQRLITKIQAPAKPKSSPNKPPRQPRKPKEFKGRGIANKEKKDKSVQEFYEFLVNHGTYIKIKDTSNFGTRPSIYRYIHELGDKVKTAIVKHQMYVVTADKSYLLDELTQPAPPVVKEKKLTLEDKVLACVLASENPITVMEVARANGFNRIPCYRVFNKLVEKKLIAKLDTPSTSYYIGIDKSELLNDLIDKNDKVIVDDNAIKIVVEKPDLIIRDTTLDTVLNLVKNSTDILCSSIFKTQNFGFCDRTGVRTIKALVNKGYVACSDIIRGQRFYFCDASKPELVEKIININNSHIKVKVLEVLQSTSRFLSINDIMKMAGRNYTGGGGYRYVKKIVEGLNCEVAKNNSGTYYRLRR